MSTLESIIVIRVFVARLKFRYPVRPNGAGGVVTSDEFPSCTSSLKLEVVLPRAGIPMSA
jgi:hypothetical protein